MKRIALSLAAIALLASCAKNPITGRSSLNLLPESEMMSMSYTEYRGIIQKSQVISTGKDAEMVKRVGQRIANAVTTYMNSKGLQKNLQGYQWEFNLVQGAEVNAWCMPGGKVVVYTGLMPVAQTETGLAVVMGHEIAHAIAKHGNERMSQQLAQQAGGVALSVALANKPQQTQDLFMASYGVGSNLAVMLPYSRKHESEADEMGLIFMAMAGYDPNEAVNFWQRMSKVGGSKPPELLSTHPSDATRIQNLQKLIPKAMTYYKK
jgi:predicted Zn-dependent protease